MTIFQQPLFWVVVIVAIGIPLAWFFINLILKKFGKDFNSIGKKKAADKEAQHVRNVVKKYDKKNNSNK